MHELISYLTLRTIFVFASTAFSLLVVMLALNIITVDEVVAICHMSPEAANAFKMVVSRIQEITTNILDIISQLLNKLFSWAGVDVDLTKIKADVHGNEALQGANPAAQPMQPAPQVNPAPNGFAPAN